MNRLRFDRCLDLPPLLVGACLVTACVVKVQPEPDPMTAGTAGSGRSAADGQGTRAGSGAGGGGGADGATVDGGSTPGGRPMSAAAGGDASGGEAPLGGHSNTAGGTSIEGGADGDPQQPPVAPCVLNQKSRCTGTSPIRCDFGGGVGDFLVTVELGGDTAGSTHVDVEANRRVLATVQTAAGESKRFSFVANVRDPEGQPVQDVPRGTPGLQVYVRGSAAELSAICAAPLTTPTPRLWVAGDSTVCDQSDNEYAGWAQHLPAHFREPVSVSNYADSGESSSSILDSAAMWGAIKASWKEGDWVLVQVGHNDKAVSPATFRANMMAYVTQAKAARVNVILCTPISRVGGTLASQHQSSGGANIPQIVRDIAASENVPVIDLTAITWNWLQKVGDDWPRYFALGTDRTHLNPTGAEIVAGFARDAIAEQQLMLAVYLR